MKYFLLIASILSLPSHAALEVIADHGGIPAAPYFEILAGEPPVPPLAVTLPTQVTTADMLPVKSPALSPGLVESRPVKLLGLVSPLFLVGDDELSLSWISQHKASLQRLGAVGWAVNVSDEKGLRRLRDAAGGLAVLPIRGDDLANRIPLLHYPVLITATSIEQ